MLFSATAFILRVDVLTEKDLVAALLTDTHGVVRAVVHGARGRSKRAAALQLLTQVRVTWFQREGAELASLREIEIAKSTFALSTREETALLIPYFCESLLEFLPPAEPAEKVYRLLNHVLENLLREPAAAPLAARYFEVWLLRLSGLFPEVTRCAVCGEALDTRVNRFDTEALLFVHPECAPGSGLTVSGDASRLLARLLRSPLPSLGPVEDVILKEIEVVAREIRRRFLGHELKSYAFLLTLL